MKRACFLSVQPARVVRHALISLALASYLIPQRTPASGVVTNCTDADLRAALAGGGLVTFNCDGTIVLTNTLLIENNTVIDGSGHTVVISGGGAVRPFVVSTRLIQLTLKNVTVADGFGANFGGAILLNPGSARLIDCTFSNNAAVDLQGFPHPGGGAVYFSATDADRLDISGCAFLFNRVVPSNDGSGGLRCVGGAIAVPGRQQLSITNSTFFGNVAPSFGAISFSFTLNIGFGVSFLVNSTFAGNSNGAVAVYQSPMRMMNCLFASNNGPNCLGVTDWGYNISSDASGGFTHPFSLQNVDPRLKPLADNGGPTLSMALLPDSPAIDGGSSTVMPGTDQRGMPRPFGATSDVGAYEFIPTGTTSGEFHLFATTNIVSETAGSVAFTVIRAGGTTGEASVSFATGNGSATAGSDFVATNGVLHFGAGQQSNTVSVTVLDDSAIEGNENFHMTLSNPTGGPSLGRAVAAVTIVENDSAFQISSANYSVGEESNSVVLTVLRAGPVDATASVNFAALQGTALDGNDFLATNGVLNFASGQASATVAVTIVDDLVPEPTETFTLQLSNPTGGVSLGTPAMATVTIIDNDPVHPGAVQFSAAEYSVSETSGEVLLPVVRVGGTNGVVTAHYSTSQGTAHAGSDFMSTNGTLVFGDTETSKLIRVAVTPDAVAEGPESFSVELSNPTGGATLGDPAVATVTILDGMHTLTTCDETSLRAAVSAGGQVTLACDGTIFLTAPLQVSGAVTLDASGHNVTLSGSNAVRLFLIQPGATLALRNLTLADGRAVGTNGDKGQVGGPGEGGAIYNKGATLLATDCSFLRNNAVGGKGGMGTIAVPIPGIREGPGGMAAGGAILSIGGGNFLTNIVFRENFATGGDGGTNPTIDGGGSWSGAACGGAIYLSGGTLSVHNGQFTNNGAAFGKPFFRGLTADVAGGAIYSSGGAVTIEGCSFFGNACGFTPPPSGTPSPHRKGNASGGAISHQGDRLALTDSLFLANRAWGGPTYAGGLGLGFPGGDGLGGAVFVNGSGAITNCTLAGNLAQGGPWGGGLGGSAGSGLGGAICNQSTLVLLNCTIVGNAARAGMPAPDFGSGMGGGLCNTGGVVTLNHVTVADNLVSGTANLTGYQDFLRGGGLFSTNGTATILNSIITHSLSGNNGFGTFVDGGHNISSDASFHFSAPGSVNNTDPVLSVLGDFGGPTPTMALLAGSPALDAADSANCPATDQRGIARPFGAGCDIGAFESAPPYTILGHVHGFTTPASGIQLTWPSGSTNVPPGGQFTIRGLATGTHLLSVSSPECVFVPRTLSLTVGPDIVDAGFFSYRTNALFIERLSPGNVRWVYAGEAGATYHVLSGTNVTSVTPTSTNQAQANGLIEFMEGSGVPMRFIQVLRP